jgi:hypothetical protein
MKRILLQVDPFEKRNFLKTYHFFQSTFSGNAGRGDARLGISSGRRYCTTTPHTSPTPPAPPAPPAPPTPTIAPGTRRGAIRKCFEGSGFGFGLGGACIVVGNQLGDRGGVLLRDLLGNHAHDVADHVADDRT